MKIPAFSKTYGEMKVLDFPGMTLQKGSICAVLGSNGSGKSTFAKVLSGIIYPDSKIDTAFSKQHTIGYLPQKPYAFRASVMHNILINGTDRNRAEFLMHTLDLSHLASKRGDRLSGGETSRMMLARIMMKDYNLLILDEPTAAMDISSTALSEELILRYVRHTDGSLILITHSLSQAKRLADQILFFHNGILKEQGEKNTVFSHPVTSEFQTFLNFYG